MSASPSLRMTEYQEFARHIIQNNYDNVGNYLNYHAVYAQKVNENNHDCQIKDSCGKAAGEERDKFAQNSGGALCPVFKHKITVSKICKKDGKHPGYDGRGRGAASKF